MVMKRYSLSHVKLACYHGAAVRNRGKQSACSAGAHSAGTVAPAELVSRSAQWRAKARGKACHRASCLQHSGYCSTRLADAPWCAEARGDECQRAHVAPSFGGCCTTRRVDALVVRVSGRPRAPVRSHLSGYYSTYLDAHTQRELP